MNLLNVQDFTAGHIDKITELIDQLWHNPSDEMSKELHSLAHQCILRYYYVPSSHFNLVAIEGGEICACLLAARACDLKNNLANEWLAGCSFRTDVLNHIQETKAYLDSMCNAENHYAAGNEAVLLFFGSVRKGAGRELMTEFEKRCKEQNIGSMILWTDESCNYGYYYQKGFEEVAKFPSPTATNGKHFMTWIFRKHF